MPITLTPTAPHDVLTKRIRWLEDSNGSPSFNHCWMIWDWQHRGPPSLANATTTSRAEMSALARIADSLGTSQDVADVPKLQTWRLFATCEQG